MGKGGSTETTGTVRYAPYIEAWHQTVIANMNAAATAAVAANPYDDYPDMDFEAGFFGTGFLLSSFPSLYDMYGKFMAGLDIEVLFDEAFEDTVNGTVVNDAVSAEALRLEDEIEQEVLPRYELGMRDINAAMSSTFVVGKALIEAKRVQAISKFSAETRLRLLPLVTDRWKAHLEWNRATIDMYAQILKLYIAQKVDVDDRNMDLNAKFALWPFQAYQYVVQAIGAMSGAVDTKESKKEKKGLLGSVLQIAGAAAMFV
jgi:hypothetical protein